MKNQLKILKFIFVFLLSAQLSLAQETNVESNAQPEKEILQHELSLNALYVILGALEAKYEYLLNENSGVGISAMYTFDDDLWEYEYYVTGHYRQYFGKKYAGGFYGEAFLMYNSIEDYEYYFTNGNSYIEEDNSHNLAIGFGFGTKLISKNNLLLDVGLGLGRNFISSGDEDFLVPRFNVNFGYRF